MRLVQDQIAQWVPGEYHSLGADGFGFSTPAPAAAFHIDGPSWRSGRCRCREQGKVDVGAAAQAADVPPAGRERRPPVAGGDA